MKLYFTGSWNTKITKNTKKKVVTDMGEAEHCKKYSRDLMNISKKVRTPSFLSTRYMVVTEEGTCLFVDRVVPETTEHPMQPMVSFS